VDFPGGQYVVESCPFGHSTPSRMTFSPPLSLSHSGCESLDEGSAALTRVLLLQSSRSSTSTAVRSRLMRSSEMVFIHLFFCLPQFRRPYTSALRIRLTHTQQNDALKLLSPSDTRHMWAVADIQRSRENSLFEVSEFVCRTVHCVFFSFSFSFSNSCVY